VTLAALALTLPSKRVSAWTAETDPKYAKEWIASLPLADSAETAREIYQALYTLNRQDLDATRRYELMEIYIAPVASVTSALESHFIRAPLPLTPKKRQLADFLRQMHMEMAYGYKACLQDLERQRIRWGKKPMRVQALARVLHYLSEVLIHSYQVYMPYPAEVWHEIHSIYQYADKNGMTQETVEPTTAGESPTTIDSEYVRTLLLGLNNPYQLPQGECRQVQRILRQCSNKAVIRESVNTVSTAGYFLIDPATDSPPIAFPRGVAFKPDQGLRQLDAVELLQSVQFFIQRLQQGDGVKALKVGIDCLDSVCLDILQRMMRSWGQLPRRQYSRIQRSGPAFVCAGIPALHFFASGQKPCVSPMPKQREDAVDDRFILPAHIEEDVDRETSTDEGFIELNQPVSAESVPPKELRELNILSGEGFRVDRWKIKDTAPKGLQLMRFGTSHTYVRVGDVVGIQQMDEVGRWSAGVVRWMKSPEGGSLEMGIELLASGVKPVAVTLSPNPEGREYLPALLLPPIEALHRPATILVPRGVFTPGSNMSLSEPEKRIRTVRLLERLEHTNVFELLVYADVIH